MRRGLYNTKYYFFSAIMLLYSCKKEIPPPGETQPVFYCNAMIDGNPVAIQGGINNYYMYSSFNQDANNVYVFSGKLSEFDCSTCENSFEVLIKDFEVNSPGTPAQVSVSLSPGYYIYQVPGGSPTEINVQFSSSVQFGTVQSYFWDFGDGTTDNIASPLHTYSRPGIYDVCLTVTFTTSQTSSICYPVKFEVPDAGCKFLFNDVPQSGGNDVQFNSSQFSGTPPFQFSWDFGDGFVSSVSNPLHTFSAPGLYKVCLQVTDGNNRKSDYCRNVTTFGYFIPKANFAVISNSSNSNPLALSNVVVNWTDETGTTYTSENPSGQSSGFFRVLSVDSYGRNENGQAVKKVKAVLKCNLYNGASSILLDNCELVFAFAYPD